MLSQRGLLYKQYGGEEATKDSAGVRNTFNNAPFLRAGNSSDVPLATGKKREELDLTVLGWYHITKLLNIGASLDAFFPINSSGYDVPQQSQNNEPVAFTQGTRE